MESLRIEDLPQDCTLAIYGAGSAGSKVLAAIRELRPDVRVSYFLDTYKNGSLDGVPVRTFTPDAPSVAGLDLVLIASVHYEGIIRSLEEAGILNHRLADVFLWKVETDPEDLAMYRRLYPEESLAQRRFYNIGACNFLHPFWTNVDMRSEWYRQYQLGSSFIDYDLTQLAPLPVPDDSAELVYTSHTLEHVNDQAAANAFREAWRILKPGGVLRFIVPNIDIYYAAYQRNDRDFYLPNKEGATLAHLFVHEFATQVAGLEESSAGPGWDPAELVQALDRLGYEGALDHLTARCSPAVQRRFPGHHINWWNWDKARCMIAAAGFPEVRLSAYGQAFVPVLRNLTYFDNTNPKRALYVEATKH